MAKSKRITMQDVARRSRVSVATVSHVINRTGRVGEATRRRVMAAIERLGYRRHLLARSLRARRTWTIGLILADVGSPPWADFAAGVEQAAEEADYTVLLGSTGYDPRKDEPYLRIFGERQVDGVIVTTATLDSSAMLAKYAAETPLLLLARGIPKAPYDFVGSDARGGAMRLLEYLTGLGHSRIGIITGTANSQILADRLEGYFQGLKLAGIEPDDRLVVRCDYSIENGRAGALSLLKLDPPPTAILGAQDVLAFGALDALSSASISVPREVSVASFVDHPMMALTTIGLTSLTRPRRQMGAAAFSLLLRRIEGLNPSTPQSVIFPEELIIRASTGPPPRAVPSAPA